MKGNGVQYLILVFVLMMYHGCVVKAQRIKELRQCYQYRDSSQQEYERCKDSVTYISTFLDFKTVFQAWD